MFMEKLTLQILSSFLFSALWNVSPITNLTKKSTHRFRVGNMGKPCLPLTDYYLQLILGRWTTKMFSLELNIVHYQ